MKGEVVYVGGSESDVVFGWSAIAAYLRVPVRTAQKWHVENGLPVYTLKLAPDVLSTTARIGDLNSWRKAHAAPPLFRTITVPPKRAEFLVYLLLSKKDSEAVAGDLEERWRKIKKKFGMRRANFWYWTQVIRSLWPFGVAAVKRVSGLMALIAAWKKLSG